MPFLASAKFDARIGVPWLIESPSSKTVESVDQWIGLRENLQESPIFNGKIYGFL